MNKTACTEIPVKHLEEPQAPMAKYIALFAVIYIIGSVMVSFIHIPTFFDSIESDLLYEVINQGICFGIELALGVGIALFCSDIAARLFFRRYQREASTREVKRFSFLSIFWVLIVPILLICIIILVMILRFNFGGVIANIERFTPLFNESGTLLQFVVWLVFLGVSGVIQYFVIQWGFEQGILKLIQKNKDLAKKEESSTIKDDVI